MVSLIYFLFSVIGIAMVWFFFDYINREYFSFFKINDFIYWLYIPAGYRLIAVMLFGWAGAIGVAIAYGIRGYFYRGFTFETALVLAPLYGLAPLIAYQIWKKLFNVSTELNGISPTNIFWLSTLSALINGLFRICYFQYAHLPHGVSELCLMFSGNLLGTFVILYLVKFLAGYFVFNQESNPPR